MSAAVRVTLGKRYELACAHQLNGLGENHKCARLHGHNYVVEIEVTQLVEALAGSNGMVIDADHLDIDVRPVLKRLDHRCLNELGDDAGPPGASEELKAIARIGAAASFEPLRSQPTVENLCLYLWNALQFMSNNGTKRLSRVRVYEETWLWAEIRGEQ